MRPIEQYGLWRLGSLLSVTKHRGNLRRFILGEDYWLDTPNGVFHCLDRASAYQFVDWWEPKVKEEVRKLHGGLFVDIGANIGYYSVMAAKQGNKVYAIEPGAKAFAALVVNISMNGVKQLVRPVNAAAWWEDTVLRLRQSRHYDTAQIGMEGEQVAGMTIDNILADSVPDLVKIDAEGSEPYILAGMKRTLRTKPKVIFEALYYSKQMACQELLTKAGYSEFRQLDATNHIALR